MTWTTADIPDQHGRVAVVTGANGGLGLETARELARRGAHVVMAARNLDKAASARQSLSDDVPDASLEIRELDLASLESVHACAEAILDDHPRIDLLINNAGVMALPEGRTADGFELQLGINHLGHFVLTQRLLPPLLAASEAAASATAASATAASATAVSATAASATAASAAATSAARVVSVTSMARYVGSSIDPRNPHLEGRYDPWRAYAQSKLANLQFALELQRRLDSARAPVASLAADPGLSYTDLQANTVRQSGDQLMARFWYTAASTTGMPPDRGALTELRAATDPGAHGGQLFAPRYVTFGPPVSWPIVGSARNQRAGARLWTVSERETGTTFDVAALVKEHAS